MPRGEGSLQAYLSFVEELLGRTLSPDEVRVVPFEAQAASDGVISEGKAHAALRAADIFRPGLTSHCDTTPEVIDHLIGRKIVGVHSLSAREIRDMGWRRGSIGVTIHLDDGSLLVGTDELLEGPASSLVLVVAKPPTCYSIHGGRRRLHTRREV